MKKSLTIIAILTFIISCSLLHPLANKSHSNEQHSLHGRILPPDWEPKQAADKVLADLINVCAPEVKGAHDSRFVILGNHAYIVASANDVRPGENPGWPEIYCMLSVVNIKTMKVEKFIPFARSEQVYSNAVLPVGACIVPSIIQKDEKTLRCYFSSNRPGERQAQTWYIDFDLPSRTFHDKIYKAKLKTSAGVFDMQPQYFHADAVAHGFDRPASDCCFHIFDSFKRFDDKIYVAINNFRGKQNALTVVNKTLDTFEVVGHFNEPQDRHLSESAVNRLPDGTWMAILRQDGGNRNYFFAESQDGKTWSSAVEKDFVPNGLNSKPTFDKFDGIYYLGWQENTLINGVGRTVFNIDVSVDGVNWERKYRFETALTFQYPTFHEYQGSVYMSVTQGAEPKRNSPDNDLKERIMFGKLE
jgi:hypothetical protein